MPYPNEHSARLQDPSRFNPETFRRADDGTIYGRIKVPATAAVIWGKLKGRDKPADSPIPQALRFPTKNWTADEARKWLKENNVKYISFEPATGGKKEGSAAPPAVGANIQTILADLKSQIWAMEAHALEGLFDCISAQTTAPPAGLEIADKPASLMKEGVTAVIPIKGILMRKIPAAFTWWGIEGTSYETIAAQVRLAMADPAIKTIRLDVDSPGGTVPGVDETSELIRSARKTKTVMAVVDDLCASGAYWLACQADRIESVRNGLAGSIGVFCVYHDKSQMAQDLGIKVIVIRSGEHKGMGVPGDPITDNQIAAMQQIIDGIAGNFVAAVAAGRNKKKEDVQTWTTGQLWLAETAVSMGVIDKATVSISSKEQTMTELTDQQIDAQVDKNAIRQAAQTEERKRLTDLIAAFPEDLPFATAAFEKGFSLEQAKANYCDVLREKLKEQGKKGADKSAGTGAPPIAESGSDAAAQGDFLAEARQLAKEQNITVTMAMKRLNRTKPALHTAFVQQCEREGRQMYQEAV